MHQKVLQAFWSWLLQMNLHTSLQVLFVLHLDRMGGAAHCTGSLHRLYPSFWNLGTDLFTLRMSSSAFWKTMLKFAAAIYVFMPSSLCHCKGHSLYAHDTSHVGKMESAEELSGDKKWQMSGRSKNQAFCWEMLNPMAFGGKKKKKIQTGGVKEVVINLVSLTFKACCCILRENRLSSCYSSKHSLLFK